MSAIRVKNTKEGERRECEHNKHKRKTYSSSRKYLCKNLAQVSTIFPRTFVPQIVETLSIPHRVLLLIYPIELLIWSRFFFFSWNWWNQKDSPSKRRTQGVIKRGDVNVKIHNYRKPAGNIISTNVDSFKEFFNIN